MPVCASTPSKLFSCPTSISALIVVPKLVFISKSRRVFALIACVPSTLIIFGFSVIAISSSSLAF